MMSVCMSCASEASEGQPVGDGSSVHGWCRCAGSVGRNGAMPGGSAGSPLGGGDGLAGRA